MGVLNVQRCKTHINTFAASNIKPGPQGVKLIYNIPNAINFIVYGFTTLGVPSNLYVRTGETTDYENGIGFSTDLLINDRIDTLHFAQIDLGDFIREKRLKCSDPKIKIGSIQLGEGFAIYGSNVLGVIGQSLYTYTNLIDNADANAAKEITIPSYNTVDHTIDGDLYKYGSVPFRYISVTALVGNVTLNLLTLSLCSY